MSWAFSNQIKRFRVKSLDTADKVRRGSILDLFSRVALQTPVDTGRLRGNWQTTVNQPAAGELDRKDASGQAVISEISANLGQMNDTVFFTNNLPYAERIEYEGWSAQAPAGMVRVNVADWKRIVANRARSVR